MENNKYAVLHAHLSNGSVGDSVLTVKDYAKKAKQLGLTHIAMTDHGSMSAMIDFYNACKEEGIVGIIGMEAYVTDNRLDNDKSKGGSYSHLILLAKNEDGVKNLLRIHNDAQINGFYYKPRTDLSVLKKYGKNIIATSACVSGEIPKLILSKDLNAASAKIKEYQECFDEFYLEIQPGKFKDQIIVNSALAYMGKKMNVPFVATNDIHYLNDKDYLMHDLHVKSSRNKTDDEGLIYPDTCYYLMDRNKLNSLFVRNTLVTDEVIDEAINNTNKIAEQCNGEIAFDFRMPEFVGLPEGYTAKRYLAEYCWKKLNRMTQSLKNPQEYIDRLDYELDTIDKLGFNGYFLIVHDLLNYARSQKIAVGPGRGSCVASIVSWLLDITVADPIKYNLMFERFLSPNRHGLPDIDIDIDSDYRSVVQQYVINKYGQENCAFVGTFGIRKAKDALRCAGRLLGVDLEVVNTIAKTMPAILYVDDGEKNISPTIEEMLDSTSALREYKKTYPDLFDTAIALESFPKSIGIHAAGMVISPNGLLDKIPLRLYRDKTSDKQYYATTLTKENVEVQALKFDFLALRTLSIIYKTMKTCNVKIDLSDDEFYKDKAVWDMIGSKQTLGLFQIGSSTYQSRMPRLKPKSIDELAACLALVRSPCISSHTDEVYMQIVEGKQEIEKIHPLYDEITKDTNGIAIFQEEIMSIGVAFGFSSDESYALLKAVSKKKIDKIKAMRSTLYEKAAAKGLQTETVDRIWQIILDAGLYSFNRGHATAYAIVCYLSAWLKVHYTEEFMTNLLTTFYTGSNDRRTKDAVKETKSLTLDFLPADINKSSCEFTHDTKENGIRIGLCAIKSFGAKAAAEIQEKKPFTDFKDFLDKVNKSVVNKKTITVGIFAGIFNSMGDKESLLKYYYETYRKSSEEVPTQISLSKKTTDVVKINDSNKKAEKVLYKNNLIYK